jgi:S-formylglutathione hydrolase FrmB/acetyl esterase/lipase
MIKKVICLFIVFSLTFQIFAAKVDTVRVMSKSMNKMICNLVITPDSYPGEKKTYPVLFLLHGAGGNQKDWLNNAPEIKDYSDKYNIIIVCPDGSKTSWYFDSPVDSTMKYETYMAKELIGYIDTNYSTKKDSSGRAITGLSMGGHGAFYLTFRHPDIWGAAGSMSGGVDFRPFPDNWDLSKRLGDYSKYPDNWDKNVVINLLDSIKDKTLKLIFDCGVDDFFCTVNRNLHQKMLEYKIPHDYIERPGKHTWDYWQNSLKYQIVFFNDFFNPPPEKTGINKYGLDIILRDGKYVLRDEATIRRLHIFDVDNAPADMFTIYKYVPDKIKQDEYTRCTTTSYVYKTYPSRELKLEADLPQGDGPFPYIIWIHGGGWHGGDFYGHKNLSTYLASNGIAGIRISYSLFSPGVTFKDTWADIRDAVKFIREHAAEWKLSVDKFGFAGHSAGGHLSSYAAMRIKGCKLLISFNGIYDISNVQEGFVPNSSFDPYFGSTREEKEFASPAFCVPHKPPYCILTYSTGDYLVDTNQVNVFERALRAKGAKVEVLMKNYYAHAGFIGGTDIYESTALKILETAKKNLK